MFIDRTSEMSSLEGLLASKEPKLVIIYGRRRVGKTELLRNFSRKHGGIYFLARQESLTDQLASISMSLAEKSGDESLKHSPLTTYDALFTYIRDRIPEGTPIVFDEFPYLVDSNPSLPSILQDHWDRSLQNRQTFIVLCGSSIRMMERIAGHKSPIYGRRTEQMLLEPLGFPEAAEFMGSMPLEAVVECYAVLGGTPAYLQLFDYTKTIRENIETKMLPKLTFLNQDAMFILREELDEPRNYFSIMKSMSKGNTTLGAIINDTGLDRGTVSKYLSVLIDLHLAERRVPITEGRRSRKGLYHISDPYFRFWFRFIFDNLDYLEATNPKKTFEDRIKPAFNAYVGTVFEEMALKWLKAGNGPGDYAFGRWWHGPEEVDIVGLDEAGGRLALIEVKWSNVKAAEAERLLSSLAGKSDAIGWRKGQRTLKLGIIAKTIETKSKLRAEGHLAYDLRDVIGGRMGKARK